MSLFVDMRDAISTLPKGFRFIFKNGLSVYFVFPVLLSFVFFAFSWWGSSEFVAFCQDILGQYWTRDTESWYFQALGWFLTLSVRFIFVYIFLTINKYLVLILLSPVLAFLSEAVEEKVTGKKYPFVLDQFVRDVVRGVLLACRNFVYEIFWTLLILIATLFFPPFGILAPFAIFFLQSYFYGFSFMDYFNERRKVSLKQSITFTRKKKGYALVYGGVFSLFFYIPYIGLIIAPIWMEVSATLGMIRIYKRKLNVSNEPF